MSLEGGDRKVAVGISRRVSQGYTEPSVLTGAPQPEVFAQI